MEHFQAHSISLLFQALFQLNLRPEQMGGWHQRFIEPKMEPASTRPLLVLVGSQPFLANVGLGRHLIFQHRIVEEDISLEGKVLEFREKLSKTAGSLPFHRLPQRG